MKKRRRKNKKNLLILAIVLIIIISIILIFKLRPDTSSFARLGYTKKEENAINKLSNKNITYIENHEYINNIYELITNKDFKEQNLEKYIELMNISSLDIDDIIFVINGNYNTNISYNKDVIDVMKADYFIKDNLERYISYMEKNPKLDKNEIIKDVNSNIDYKFYTNVKDADITKGNLILVNKYYKLSSNYTPNNLVTVDKKYGKTLQMNKEAYEAFKEMFEAAKNDGMHIWVRSPYRSYQTQNILYESYASEDGYDKADTYSARPGYSEHQTGLAVDVVADDNSLANFENTKEFTWIKNNAYKYGFIMRYPKDKEYITGYMYESWHYRYVGKEIAKEIYDKGLTFEEYYAYYVEKGLN